MIIAFRKLSKLPVIAMSAEIILSGRTDAVPSPVPVGQNQAVQQRIVRVYTSAFAHRHMMGRIEAGSSDISPGSCKFRDAVKGICRPQGITVVLNKPKVVPAAKFFYSL